MLSITRELFQYEQNRYVHIKNYDEDQKNTITHVQFYNKDSQRAIVVAVSDGKAKIPSVLLKVALPIYAIGCRIPITNLQEGGDYEIITRKIFKVFHKPKNNDYEYLGDQQEEKVPYTSLTKKNWVVTIHCHNLIPGKAYKICLENRSRYRGCKNGDWRHPSNFNQNNIEDRYGYVKTKAEIDASEKNKPWPSVPKWMPNNGFVQTEWEFIAKSYEAEIKVDINRWLLSLRKPQLDSFGRVINWCGLIGLQNNKQSKASLIFRFPIFEKEESYFQSKNRAIDILKVGGVKSDTILELEDEEGEKKQMLEGKIVYSCII